MKSINNVENLRNIFNKNADEILNLDGGKSVGFARASTQKQAEKQSHDIQKDWIDRERKKRRLDPSCKEILFIAETGFHHAERKKFLRFLNDLVKQKKHTGVDQIIFYDTSRATRNQESKVKIEQMIYAHDFKFIFSKEDCIRSAKVRNFY